MLRVPTTKRLLSPPLLFTLACLTLLGAPALEAQSLRGSSSSMGRQARSAAEHDYTYLRNPAHVRTFVKRGWLVPVHSNADFMLAGVSFPYARPEVRTFIRRLGQQYRRACGERLVVTSLTRPKSHQPSNASRRSVHPTGMALDLRRSGNSKCRRWLESVLLSLERKRLLEATYERRPPHYHVALFPKPYARYVARLQAGGERLRIHRVARGDTLWTIARRYGTTVGDIKSANALRSNRIHPGQTLRVPSSG